MKLPLALGLLVVATFAAYSTSIRAPFQFDEIVGIVENVTIRKLWPIFGDPGVLHPPASSPLVHRPVVNVSLALNYALNDALGIDNRGPWAPFFYRVVNITVHLASAFLLMGIIRRTLRHGAMGEKFADVADLVAITVVFVWALHPIQSAALLYRTELLVAACYLGALYGSIRAWDASSRAAAAGWYVAAVVVGLMGMGCKEVMISMPLAVMLYDRAFRNDSWRQTFGRRWWFYGPLCLTTALLIYIMTTGQSSNSIGFHLGVAWFEYLYTQCWAILRYVQLFFWPDRLTLDYGPQMIRDARGVVGAIALTAFGVLTAAVWIKPRWWAWWVAVAGALTAALLVRATGDRLSGPLVMAASITFFVIAALETVGRFVRVSGWVWLAGTLAASAMVLGLLSVRIVSFPPEAMREHYAYVAISSLLVLSAFSLRALAPRLPIDRWGWLGFLGAWFFMILAPSSSFVPLVTEAAAERRIYLSLAAVIVLVLLGVEVLRRRRAWQFVALAAVAVFYVWVSGWLTNRWLESFVVAWTVRLIVAAGATGVTYVMLRSRANVRTAALAIMMLGLVVGTAVRGSMYNDAEAIWRDVTVKVPENPRGWDNVGSTLAPEGSHRRGRNRFASRVVRRPGVPARLAQARRAGDRSGPHGGGAGTASASDHARAQLLAVAQQARRAAHRHGAPARSHSVSRARRRRRADGGGLGDVRGGPLADRSVRQGPQRLRRLAQAESVPDDGSHQQGRHVHQRRSLRRRRARAPRRPRARSAFGRCPGQPRARLHRPSARQKRRCAPGRRPSTSRRSPRTSA